MKQAVDAVRRFNNAGLRWESEHPALWGALYTLLFAAIQASFGLLPFNRFLALYLIGFAGAMAALEKYLWRRGGMKRKRYQRRLERATEEEAATGWFADPTARHRVRYMKRAKWTRWVADGGEAFEDRGAVRHDFLGPAASAVPTRRARPLLIGFVVSGLLGVGLIIPALLFPHSRAIGIISADNTHRVGSGWWGIGLAIVVVISARALFVARAHLDVSAQDPALAPTRSHDRVVAFAHSFLPMTALAATAAWGTWIQNGLMFPFPLFSFFAIAGCVGVALVAAIFAVKVSRIEQTDHAILRTRGLLPALRGAFVEAAAAP